MKIIILEGTATSGKTTLANLLTAKLRRAGRKVFLVDENKTLMPVLKTPDAKTHLDHLNKIVGQFPQEDCDVIIADRFHLTSAAICDMSAAEFENIEKQLLKWDPIIVFLKVDEDELGNRIFKSMNHRGPSWRAHVSSKGGEKEIRAWYLETQEKLSAWLKKSKIKHITIDTTNPDYEKIAEKLLNSI